MNKGHEIDEWMPLFLRRWMTSDAIRAMKDYQRGWYIELLVRAWDSEVPCHLRLDQKRLWMTAGAESREYFVKHCGIVLDEFQVAEIEGQKWIVQPNQLAIYRKQLEKYRLGVERARKGGKAKAALSMLQARCEHAPSIQTHVSNLNSSSSSDKEKNEIDSEDLIAKIMAIGFRDSTWRSKSQIARALFEEIEHGSDSLEMIASLCRIYKWTENGEFAPKCFEVIPRWREPQNLWERRNGKSNGNGAEVSKADLRAEQSNANIQRAFSKLRRPAGSTDAGNA